MLDALLHGKLSREQENMEDILTSSVFGLLRLLAPEMGIIPFLSRCEDISGDKPLSDFRPCEVDYEFWPTWSFPDCYNCEPDVVLTCLSPNGSKHIVAIEAKLNSPKSSEADPSLFHPYDQLARELDNLKRLARSKEAQPILVYLTADITIPTHDIQNSIKDYRRFRPNDPESPAIYWLTWRVLPSVFGNRTDTTSKDLVRLAARLGLRFFSRVSDVCNTPQINWSFSPDMSLGPILPNPIWRWSVNPKPSILVWSFSR